MPRPQALKGTRPVFFPDAGKTLPTKVWDRYALGARRVSIDGPAVFEEDESTFIVGPGATARLLADGSILAEVDADGPHLFDPDRASSFLWRRADLRLVDEAARVADGAHQLLDPGARELRFLLRHHRRRRASRWCRPARASRASSAPARDGEALPALLPARPARAGRRADHQRHLARAPAICPDITLAKPIFKDGKLVAFSATTAHAPDIGGKIRSPEPREVFEEGLQIPPMKMIAAGKTDETLVTIIRKNVRTPDQTMGDLWAQVVALDLMEDRLRVLMEGYGLPDLTDLAREIQGRCETAMRAAIRELPDGTYRSELKTDGLMETPITLKMALTIKGDEILMDFAGTDCQVDRAINCALCYTNAMAMYGVKVCTSPNLPNNEGAWRPITLKRAAEGCIVNPQFPAPGGSRMLIGHYVPMLVFGCLGQIVPERVMAACGSPMWGMNQSGVRDDGKGGGKPYANMFFYNGGMGGNTQRDGVTCLSLAVERQLDLDRDQRAHRAAALPSQEAAARLRRRRPPSRRTGPGDPDRKPQRHADRRLLPRRAHAASRPSASKAARTARRASCASTARRPIPRSSTSCNKGDTVSLGTPGGGGHGDPRQRDLRGARRRHQQRLCDGPQRLTAREAR